ncbi:F-box/FBD/LRR-repeat protein [Rhynchospora pubera]|uniref:F-box/FBD/LRR-repeat protein n=1 Tax=Rhynchospora pubera TaxID=906938 RepID=A0AAV8CGK6_9POAL|nr:F-box/FBD/LRR-repeat protein [Rhynchospora pubera]
MATFQTELSQHEVDHLLLLPDALLITILSLLPTDTAARTSVLCRRFRDLCEACPSVNLTFGYHTRRRPPSNVAKANSALFSRQPSDQPLLSLRLHLLLSYSRGQSLLPSDLTLSFISSLFAHAHPLRLRHLTLDGDWNFELFEICLRSVFSISSLESLSICIHSQIPFPSGTTLTRLKSLTINLEQHTSTQVRRLLLELSCLGHLNLSIYGYNVGVINLSSLTIKTLELMILPAPRQVTYSVGLFMPKMEFLYITSMASFGDLPHFHGDFPVLRKSVITLHSLYRKDVASFAQLLNCISHVEELSLELKGYYTAQFHCRPDRRKWNAWRSKLPRNTDGNYQYACFSNLHLRENDKGFKKLLNKKFIPKKVQAHN